MRLVGDLEGKTEENMTSAGTELRWNRRKFTLATKVTFKSATKIASKTTSKIARVNGP